MSQATLTVEVNVEPEQLFDVIVDFDKYSEFLSEIGMLSNRVLKQTDREAEVEASVKKMGFTETYTLRYQFERPSRVTWSLVKGKLTKDNKGGWDLQSIGPGRTRATYRIEASFGWMVPKALVMKGVETELPKLLDAFKKRAESLKT
jgi:ribosome-associated toxin RatA of RatAB toxin-antitoxin module